jgi:hypothetical protein
MSTVSISLWTRDRHGDIESISTPKGASLRQLIERVKNEGGMGLTIRREGFANEAKLREVCAEQHLTVVVNPKGTHITVVQGDLAVDDL